MFTYNLYKQKMVFTVKNIWKSYIWTADKDMKKIAVVKKNGFVTN